MKIALTIVGAILVLFGTMFIINQAFAMLSSPSDVAVAGGLLILIGITFIYVLLAVEIWKRYRLELQKNVPTFIFGVLTFALMTGCGRIDPGHVGIKVNNWGSDRGVVGADIRYDEDGNPILPDNVVVITGGYLYNPFTSSVFEYPTFTQRAIWTKNPKEGSPNNEEICYNSKEGMVFCTDITFAYELNGKLVPAFYVKYRTDNLITFTHGILRDITRDAMNEASPAYTAEELYAEKKEEFLKEAKKRVNDRLGKYGVIISNFGYASPPRPPDAIVGAINNKLKAIQDAQRVENELREERAKVAKIIAKAQGERDKAILEAEGRAKSNERLAASLTLPVVEWERLQVQRDWIAKWNGAPPQVQMGSGGSGIMFNMPIPVK